MRKADLSRLRVDGVDLDQPLGRYLILLFRAFETELLEELRKGGYRDVTATDLNVLRFVRVEGSLSTEIAELAGITKQGVGKLVRDLARRGYLRRREDAADGRARPIEFTGKGERMIQKAIGIIEEIEDGYRDRLGNERFVEVKESLGALLELHVSKKKGGRR